MITQLKFHGFYFNSDRYQVKDLIIQESIITNKV